MLIHVRRRPALYVPKGCTASVGTVGAARHPSTVCDQLLTLNENLPGRPCVLHSFPRTVMGERLPLRQYSQSARLDIRPCLGRQA